LRMHNKPKRAATGRSRFTTRLQVLPDDLEAPFLASRSFPLNFDPFNARMRWPAVTPAYHALNCCARPLEDCFNTAVIEIAHPALDTADACALVGVVAEIHSLYAPID
jgi:hypothetical protein